MKEDSEWFEGKGGYLSVLVLCLYFGCLWSKNFRCVKVGIYVFREFLFLFEVGVGNWGLGFGVWGLG